MSNFKNFSVMKKIFKFMTLATAAVAVMVFTGCSSDDEFLTSNGGEKAPQTRAAKQDIVIDFEDFDASMMANTTSWGRNYYKDTLGMSQVFGICDGSYSFFSTVNEYSNETSFMYGGIALSNWCMMSNPSTNPNPYASKYGTSVPEDWWYTEFNQMSVYNTARTGMGDRGGAGASGDNFGVVFGFDDSYGYIKEASFELQGEVSLKSLKICNTAYTYGVIQHGNIWYKEDGTVSGTAVSLKDTKGYLTLIIKCFDANDNIVKRIETPLADYQNNRNFCITEWTEIPINADNVYKVQFGFWGSDVGPDGLNTPAYVAIDDITYSM